MHFAVRALLALLTINAIILGVAIRRYFNARSCTCPRCLAGLDHDATPFAAHWTKPTLELIIPELSPESTIAQHAQAG